MTEYSSALENKLKALTLTSESARWVMKALDPVRGGPTQIPDAIQVATLAPEYKVTEVINAPNGLAPGLNWDAIMVFPPSDRAACYWATNAAGIDFSNTVPTVRGVIENCLSTLSPNGQLYGSPFAVATGLMGGGKLDYRSVSSSELPCMWRTTARSATVYATGSDLYNQGTVYGGQYARQSTQTDGQAVAMGAGLQDVVVNLDGFMLPLREQDMATMTPGFYTANAREGIYTVHRLCGPSQEFITPCAPRSWRSSDGAFRVLNSTDPTDHNLTTGHLPRFFTDAYYAVSPTFPLDTNAMSSGFDKGCTWGVVIFRGLHPQMSLTVKTVTCLEMVPSSAAPSRQFIKPPMLYEPTAIAAYYAIASSVPTCMASRHNFLGSILPVLSGIASKVLPFLAPIAAQGLTALAGRISRPAAREAAPARRAPSSASVVSRRSVRSVRSVRSSKGGRRVKIAKPKRRGK